MVGIMKKEKYSVTGMTCSACSSHVEKSVSKVPGMKEVSVNLLTNSMQVAYDDTLCDEQLIVEAVEKAGYGASLATAGERGDASSSGRIEGGQKAEAGDRRNQAGREAIKGKKENKEMKTRLTISIVFMLLLMVVSMHHMFFMWLHIPVPELFKKLFHGNENALTFAFTQLLLTLPIIYVNRKYYQTGFKTLFHGSPNMDSLIAVGSGAALVYGIFAIYRIGYGLGHGDAALVTLYASDVYYESS
ncbi:MAG: cation transporter, partial [Lachnospiraceae bacterium]|nr:cation transporter [Lachnospiraceae bacterium]